MSALAVLLVAAPLFGLQLEPPSVEPIADLAHVTLAANLQVGSGAFLLQGDDEALTEGDEYEQEVEDSLADESTAEDTEAAETGESDESEYRAQVKRRIALTKVHRPLGLATWAAMTATITLGAIQYYNLYGFFADQASNPCVKGTAIFGQDQCTGFPWPHAVAAGVTTGLYAATFTVSLMMPDPDDLANAKGEFGDTLRMHKLLRWVHFGGMLAQIALGIAIANHVGGLDRANDYGTLQALATVHLGLGLVTYGALTWAGALMTF